MNPSRLPTHFVRLTLCVFASVLCIPLQAADRLDAPGPGYRSQAAPPILEPAVIILSEKIDALREQFRSRGPLIGDPDIRSRPLLKAGPLLPADTLPELPRANPFDTPIRLFPRGNP